MADSLGAKGPMYRIEKFSVTGLKSSDAFPAGIVKAISAASI
jgi:hypothetical protein